MHDTVESIANDNGHEDVALINQLLFKSGDKCVIVHYENFRCIYVTLVAHESDNLKILEDVQNSNKGW